MKYIIEIPDDVQYVLLNGKADNKYYTAVRPIAELEELNSDYINEHYGQMQDEAYQRGLEDAWNVARKIAVETDDGGVSIEALYKMFGTESMCMIMKNNTVHDATDKLKAYEDKNSDRIEVGDEVTHKSDSVVWKAVCIRIDGDRQHMNLMGYTGAVGYYPVDDFTKTGKHYDIASILEAMRT